MLPLLVTREVDYSMVVIKNSVERQIMVIEFVESVEFEEEWLRTVLV